MHTQERAFTLDGFKCRAMLADTTLTVTIDIPAFAEVENKIRFKDTVPDGIRENTFRSAWPEQTAGAIIGFIRNHFDGENGL